MTVPKSLAVVGLVAAATGFLVLTSCGGGEKAANERAEAGMEKVMKATTGKDADVEIEGKSVKVKGEGFSHEMTETAQWPADMFPGVPEFTFGKVARVSKGEEGGMTKFNIFLRDMEPGSVEKYVEILKKAGWSADLTAMGGKGGLVAGQKGDLGMNFMYSAEKGDGMLAVFSGMDK
jgi:hypothetical protein